MNADITHPTMVIIVGNKKCWHKVKTASQDVTLITPREFDRQFKGKKIPEGVKVIDLRERPDLWEDE